MKIHIELDERTVKTLVTAYLKEQLSPAIFDQGTLTIEVRSKQNYCSEWEKAAFRATFERG